MISLLMVASTHITSSIYPSYEYTLTTLIFDETDWK